MPEVHTNLLADLVFAKAASAASQHWKTAMHKCLRQVPPSARISNDLATSSLLFLGDHILSEQDEADDRLSNGAARARFVRAREGRTYARAAALRNCRMQRICFGGPINTIRLARWAEEIRCRPLGERA